MSDFTKRKDLTRWNRSGLSRFRYVDGNAPTHLETLRLSLIEAFTDGDGKNQWSGLETAIPVPASETAAQRQKRWIDQYRADRRDYGWEILRAFARSAHVLTEHMDAYANEGYLGTATQWDYLRRLVEMLDYHPAPPASAETPIVLLARKDKAGTVKAGFSFKNKPDDGSKPSIFETLEDVEVDYRMNELRPADWNKSQELFVYGGSASTTSFPLDKPLEGVSAGGLGVLVIDREGGAPLGVAIRVSAVSDDALELVGEAKPAGWPLEVRLHQVHLLLAPKFKQAPRLIGDNVVVLASGHGLSLDSVVAWKDGSAWKAARVERLERDRAKLSRAAPADGAKLYIAVYSDAQTMTIGGTEVKRVILPLYSAGNREEWAIFDASLQGLTSFSTTIQDGTPVYDYLSGDANARVYYVPSAGGVIHESATVLESRPQELTLEGAPGGLASGGWVVAEITEGNRKAATIEVLEEGEKSFTLELSEDLSAVGTLFGNFAKDVRPHGHDVNTDPIFPTSAASRSDSYSILPLELDDFPDLLDVGRTVVVASGDEAVEATVKEIDVEEGWIKVAPAIPGSELSGPGATTVYTRCHTTIYGNVARSGHGESRNEKILGSGDATRSGQSFDLDAEDVSFVADRQFATGVRAALEAKVDGRAWKQVSTLNDSEPEDPHYIVRMKQDGKLAIEFGDGRHGRRLPTGNDNVRVRLRQGAGLAGNLAAYSLEREVKPHALIDGLLQPIAATGGNDMEPADSMRENGPASVLTLDRAVSLDDFTHLAAANSGVWQARAFRRPRGLGGKDRIEVAVVPAGGGALGALGDALRDYLMAHALPDVRVTVVPHQSLILDLSVTLQIKTDEYDPDLVMEAVRRAVFDAFSLKKAKLGQPFYISRVFSVVEAVDGVENCQCVIDPDGFHDASGGPASPRFIGYGREGAIQRITPEDAQAIYMDEESSILEVAFQELNL